MHLFSSPHSSRRLQVACMALVVSAILPSPQLPAQGKGSPVEHPSFYRTITIDGRYRPRLALFGTNRLRPERGGAPQCGRSGRR
jgi:hypothetical protein